MSPRLLRTLSLALVLAGLALAGWATWRLHALEARSAALAAAGREAGDAFKDTLEGRHATRLLEALDARRAVALERAGARRDRLLGGLVALLGLLGLAAARAFRRIAEDVEEHRRVAEEIASRRAPPGRG